MPLTSAAIQASRCPSSSGSNSDVSATTCFQAAEWEPPVGRRVLRSPGSGLSQPSLLWSVTLVSAMVVVLSGEDVPAPGAAAGGPAAAVGAAAGTVTCGGGGSAPLAGRCWRLCQRSDALRVSWPQTE